LIPKTGESIVIPIRVALLPSTMLVDDLPGSVAVVIDVLRASTTITHALVHGARAVVPCLTVEDARSCAESIPPDQRLLGGERHGEMIDGFDLDNSPFGYTPEVVTGKTIFFTTTNGTKALNSAVNADAILIGAFVNFSAIVSTLIQRLQPITLVCAGTNGNITGEDVLFAGAVIDELLTRSPDAFAVDDLQAQMALDFYRTRASSDADFQSAFQASDGAVNLFAIGMNRDIERSQERNLFDAVPVWERDTNEIHLAE